MYRDRSIQSPTLEALPRQVQIDLEYWIEEVIGE
jgi:hypothetical protein